MTLQTTATQLNTIAQLASYAASDNDDRPIVKLDAIGGGIIQLSVQRHVTWRDYDANDNYPDIAFNTYDVASNGVYTKRA